MNPTLAGVALFGYLLGSIPFGWVVARTRGIDIRKHGSGNVGATNVTRTLGKKWGVLVFALDFLKGAAAAYFAGRIGAHTGCAIASQLLAGLAVIIGHLFPVWLRFKGGKGIATSAGVLFALVPLALLVCVVLWMALFFATRFVSVASLAAALALPVSTYFVMRFLHQGHWAFVYLSCAACLLAVWRHKTNIQRLLAGTESRFEKKSVKK